MMSALGREADFVILRGDVSKCEGFRMAAAAVTARHIRAAGVRKPPREETAHGGREWRGRLYGDLSAAGELAD